MARLSESPTSIQFWRDPDGPEIDWIIDKDDHYLPIEVKWTDSPTKRDGKHLNVTWLHIWAPWRSYEKVLPRPEVYVEIQAVVTDDRMLDDDSWLIKSKLAITTGVEYFCTNQNYDHC